MVAKVVWFVVAGLVARQVARKVQQTAVSQGMGVGGGDMVAKVMLLGKEVARRLSLWKAVNDQRRKGEVARKFVAQVGLSQGSRIAFILNANKANGGKRDKSS
jgi:hypothetical protein